jgi:hypothetical protein
MYHRIPNLPIPRCLEYGLKPSASASEGHLDDVKALEECGIEPNDHSIARKCRELGRGRECRVAGTEEDVEVLIEESVPGFAYFGVKFSASSYTMPRCFVDVIRSDQATK